jgi:hypothetical protein
LTAVEGCALSRHDVPVAELARSCLHALPAAEYISGQASAMSSASAAGRYFEPAIVETREVT